MSGLLSNSACTIGAAEQGPLHPGGKAINCADGWQQRHSWEDQIARPLQRLSENSLDKRGHNVERDRESMDVMEQSPSMCFLKIFPLLTHS